MDQPWTVKHNDGVLTIDGDLTPRERELFFSAVMAADIQRKADEDRLTARLLDVIAKAVGQEVEVTELVRDHRGDMTHSIRRKLPF